MKPLSPVLNSPVLILLIHTLIFFSVTISQVTCVSVLPITTLLLVHILRHVRFLSLVLRFSFTIWFGSEWVLHETSTTCLTKIFTSYGYFLPLAVSRGREGGFGWSCRLTQSDYNIGCRPLWLHLWLCVPPFTYYYPCCPPYCPKIAHVKEHSTPFIVGL